MKTFQFLVCCFALFISLGSYGQQDLLIRKALADTSNFRVMRFWNEDKKMPKRIYVFATTVQWRLDRFYLAGLEQNEAKWSRDEHHPYNHTYLFRDTTLNKLFSSTEKKALAQKAAALKSRKLRLKTSFASTVPSFRSVKSGFMMWVSNPVYSADSSYAFIDFTVLEKKAGVTDINESYHSTVCVIFRKEAGEWQKWKLRSHVIL